MQLSEETLKILKNFSMMNSSIYIEEGSVLYTSNGTSCFARAVISENFPISFGIGDLHNFLSILSTFETPELEFGNSITITEKNKRFTYTYGQEGIRRIVQYDSIVNLFESKLEKFNFIENFVLSEMELKNLRKLSATAKLQEMEVFSQNERVCLRLLSSNRSSENSFKVDLDQQTVQNFKVSFELPNWNAIDGAYAIRVADIAFHCTHHEYSLDYLVPANQ